MRPEGFLESGEATKAVRLYDALRAADLPKQRVLEATRGAILARQGDSLPLLLDQLRSSDRELFGIGLRAARELAGGHVTAALASELGQAETARRAPLLLALADRKDPGVQPAVIEIARGGVPELRLVAVNLLVDLGDADGNLTQDGRWTYVWEGENRLVQMKRDTDTPTGARQRLVFEYDHQGRRIRKQYYTYSVTVRRGRLTVREAGMVWQDGGVKRQSI